MCLRIEATRRRQAKHEWLNAPKYSRVAMIVRVGALVAVQTSQLSQETIHQVTFVFVMEFLIKPYIEQRHVVWIHHIYEAAEVLEAMGLYSAEDAFDEEMIQLRLMQR